jgi:clan AA aspartic protease (TIGR02281 family)
MIHTFSKPYRRSVLRIASWGLLVGCVWLGSHVHAGAMYRWVDAQGHIHLTDTPPPSTPDRPGLKVYQPSGTSPSSAPRDTPAAEPGVTAAPSPKPGGVVVDAVLNRRLTVPLRLDTGAELTVLTKQVAHALGITALDHLPTHSFSTAGGMVNFPITSLRSLRVGSTEARDVNVAIDTEGRLPVGLLGQSFLRRFKMTVDYERGHVTFDR